MLCSSVLGSRISLFTAFRQEARMPHLRILLPQLQKSLLQDPVPCRPQRGRGPLPALRKQEHRAVLVGLQRHHVEKERVSTSPGGSPSKRAVLFPIRSDDLQLLLVYAWV